LVDRGNDICSLTEKQNEKLRNAGVQVGSHARIWGKVDRHAKNRLIIGDYTCLAANSFIILHCPVKGMAEETLRINIGHDVWIGYGTLILPGVTIGNRALIGAGSVVSKDIPHDSIYAGNPARFVGTRDKREIVRTHLLIRQNLMVSVPTVNPVWDITKTELMDLFDIDLLDGYEKLLRAFQC